MLAVEMVVESYPSIESVLNAPRVKRMLNPVTGKLDKHEYTLNEMMIEAIEHEKKGDK
ncbi:hypothetical protein [Exiguobacterium sp. s102]|uniref:hypothetical protein n=1 Tax=Exiguobacterium sp. s102 TaxID=2751212 RepID=UPI001BE71E61|nr:hypothetical protein [Exiguobacterium sp. s102]